MIRVRNVKVNVIKNDLMKKISKKINSNNFILEKILHKSIDARNKNNIFYVYDVVISSYDKIIFNNDISLYEEKENILLSKNENKNIKPIIIIGFGPAGMFSAYILSSLGYKVIVFERGKSILEREKDVNNFWENNILNENSNVLFGEGGAGTFSDGKLMTSIKDKEGLISWVLKIFYENGADENILYENHPHIGTDKLKKIVQNMREKIISNGGEIHFESMLTHVNISCNKIKSIIINNKDEYLVDDLILAIGHGAKDTFKMLYKNGFNLLNKPFAVGIRIIHDENFINQSQYGKFSKYLPPAEYKLTYQINKRGVYSFCMCPGGFVVNSSSENNRLSINGMSYSKRDSGLSNSAIIVTINENDYGTKDLASLKYIDDLEKKAYEMGNGLVLIQSYDDYKNNTLNDKINYDLKIKGKTIYTNINDLFTLEINDSLKKAIEYFSTKIKDFNKNAIICAVESKTSSPIKFIRDEKMMSNINGVYPIGEGSGYSGGITTSAIEGIKVAKVINQKYQN